MKITHLFYILVAVAVSSCTTVSVGDPNFQQAKDTKTIKRIKGDIVPPPEEKGGWITDKKGPEKPKKPEMKKATIHFAYNKSLISEDEIPKIVAISKYLKEHKMHELRIEGHCDERGSEEYNRALGEHRAIAIRDYLIEIGIAKRRLHTQSFGEEKLKDSGKTENSHRKNRRAELFVLKTNSQSSR